MSKLELVEAIATRADVSNRETEKILNAFVSTITEEIKKGNKIVVYGLGSFEKVKRSARIGINPSTNERIQIPAKNIPKFKAARAFKEAVAES